MTEQGVEGDVEGEDHHAVVVVDIVIIVAIVEGMEGAGHHAVVVVDIVIIVIIIDDAIAVGPAMGPAVMAVGPPAAAVGPILPTANVINA